MIPARQSTAKTIIVGQVLDSTGAIVTDSVVGNFEGSVNGGDPAALNGSATLTHRGQGFYSLALTATDLATVGTFQVTINDGSDACPKETLVVMEEAIYDALFAASANGFAGAAGSSTVTFSNTTIATATAVTTVNGLANNVITAASIATGAIDADAIADNAIDAGAIATGAITAAKFAANALDAAWSTAERTLTAATNITDSGAALTLTTSGYVRADVSSWVNENQTTTLDAAVNFEVFFNNGAVSPITLNIDGVATAAELLKVPKSDGAATWNATALASIQSEANDALVANHLDHLFQTAYDPASKPGAADALLNELVQNDGGVAQFTANALELAPTGGSAPTVEQIADEVQTRTIAGVTLVATTTNLTNAPTSGDFTATMKTSIGTAVAASAVASVTGNVGGNVVGSVGSVVGAVGSVTGAVGSVTGAVGSVTGNVGGNVVGSVGSVTGLTASNLDATVSSRLASASYTAPPSAATIASTILAAGDVDGYSLEETLKLCLAALAGKLSGAATTTITIRSADDSANRITATVDSDGNRTAVTLNAAG